MADHEGHAERWLRKSVRLPGFDYASVAAYFVTICWAERRPVLGIVEGDQVKLSELGAIVAEEWVDSCRIRQEIVLDEFVVMPNHLHAIVFIVGATGGRPAGRSQDDCPQGDRRSPLRFGPAPRSLSSLVAGFKSAVTRRVRQATSNDQTSVWQRSFYDHVIRGDDDLLRIREYIRANPSQWAADTENPDNRRRGDRRSPSTRQPTGAEGGS